MLPDRSILMGQKLVENIKIEIFNKSSLKIPIGKFFENPNLFLLNSVTRQVNFNWTKIKKWLKLRFFSKVNF